MELLRQAERTERPVQLFHSRNKQQREVHVVIERHDGDVIGIEATFARRSVPGTSRYRLGRRARPCRQPHTAMGLPADRDDRPLNKHRRAGER
jgi:hypothetical protein